MVCNIINTFFRLVDFLSPTTFKSFNATSISIFYLPEILFCYSFYLIKVFSSFTFRTPPPLSLSGIIALFRGKRLKLLLICKCIQYFFFNKLCVIRRILIYFVIKIFFNFTSSASFVFLKFST